MYLSYETQAICRLLKKNSELSDTHILPAYPFEYKPSRPRHSTICISPGGLDMRACSLGESCYEGNYQLALDIYVPHALGSPVLQNVLEAVLRALSGIEITRIQAGEIKSNNELACFTLSCKLTFPSAFYITEDSLWIQTRENS